MTDRVKPFLGVEFAIVFSLNIAETVEPLTPEADKIRQELIEESKERGAMSVTGL
jgi:hypothetical protein